eukprot:CAMPEP_0179090624 /NCGR_PEP_ID=MMETSP0796-20121207/41354_1 /TAXON_ID=73915 /ORGANISM="Pyrodinium bahamense, Strain pbaha01" /LENGTH=360 /DNA_ID=CAMNT_0020788197 /DNA_START=62 /DNA_END=1144 /DNA_ORIENTATION=+
MSAQRDEERESLEAIYGKDFEILDDKEWRLRLGGGRVWLHVSLPADYPLSAPVPRIGSDSFDFLPAGFADNVCSRIVQEFVPGEGCVYAWCEAMEDAVRDLSDAVNTRAAVGADGEALPAEEGACTGKGECSVQIVHVVAEQVRPSLLSAGFQGYPGELFVHLDKGVTVYVGQALTITVDGIEAEDLTDWCNLQLEDPGIFGMKLLEWATAQRSEQPGFTEGEEEPVAGDFADFLPDAGALKVKRDRDLTIYTWGKAFRKAAPAESQANFNAGILNGRGGGADIRVDNGLTEAVQRNVASCSLFPRWIEMCIAKIETEGLRAVSINCTKGRHRSVAAAEILKKYYYPEAAVVHTSPAIKK